VGLLAGAPAVAQNATPPSLKEQLEAQYTLSKVHTNGTVDPGTVLVIQLAGIKGVPLGDLAMAPAIYKDGVLHPPSKSSSFGAALLQASTRPTSETSGKDFRAFPVGDKVYVSKLDVNLKNDRIMFVVVECGACNGVDQTSEYKAAVSFQFGKGYLASASVPDVEDTIAKVFTIDTGTAEPQAAQPEPQPEQPSLLQTAPAQAQGPSAQTLTNGDVIKMVQAGLDDAVIIAKIKSSQCDFDTSTDALIKLKGSGISAAVLTAMTQASGPNTNVQQVHESTLPTGYGYYLLSATGYDLLAPAEVQIVTGLHHIALGSNFVVDGFGPNTIPKDLSSSSPTFLAYEQNIDVTALHFVKLDFVSSMQAQDFDILQTVNSGMFDQFRNYYGVERRQAVKVNLWGPRASEIQLRIEPVPDRVGMFRLSPQGSLRPGRYALYYRDALHPNLIVNCKGTSDQDAVFYFNVK
jgi:hypothetical protein